MDTNWKTEDCELHDSRHYLSSVCSWFLHECNFAVLRYQRNTTKHSAWTFIIWKRLGIFLSIYLHIRGDGRNSHLHKTCSPKLVMWGHFAYLSRKLSKWNVWNQITVIKPVGYVRLLSWFAHLNFVQRWRVYTELLLCVGVDIGNVSVDSYNCKQYIVWR